VADRDGRKSLDLVLIGLHDGGFTRRVLSVLLVV
jgi:hypothetical protein